MFRRVALVRTDVSEYLSTSIISVTRIRVLGTLATDERCEIIVLALVFLRSVRRLLVTANVVLSSPILVALMVEALRSSETLVLARAAWRNIPEVGILQLLG
jgi:hypothetical protein